MKKMKAYGVSGKIAQFFLTSKLTPLIALTALLLGLAAILFTPREEEPQISVPLVDILIPFPGASVAEVESLVARPAERVMSEIKGVKYTYSASKPGLAIITVRFKVGEDQESSVVKVYDKLESNRNWVLPEAGVLQPVVKPTGINDVPIVTLTLWGETYTGYQLRRFAHNLEEELKTVEGTSRITTIGGSSRVMSVFLDSVKMSGYDVTPLEIRNKIVSANSSLPSGTLLNRNESIQVETGSFLHNLNDLKNLVIAVRNGKPVYLEDVATVQDGSKEPENYLWFKQVTSSSQNDMHRLGVHMPGVGYPAVTIAVAKKEGTNAVEIAEKLISRVAEVRNILLPNDLHMTVTRNYGKSANDKANELLEHLLLATVSVIFFIFLTLGRSAAMVVSVVIPVTLLLTLFLSWVMGFTVNRVSLFALIFSIGILVDDAIVVVENMFRHHRMNRKTPLRERAIVAVDEVGNPTILATFTVIASLLPMAFVTGLMGPYMGPIPINASAAMFISLLVAFVVTPWLSYWVMKKEDEKNRNLSITVSTIGAGKEEENSEKGGKIFTGMIGRYQHFLHQLLESADKRKRFALTLIALLFLCLFLVFSKGVVLKMLPFDNKSELLVTVDLPESSSLEQTASVCSSIGAIIEEFPEVKDYESYIGMASPINFNGLVRHSYMKKGNNMAEIQVNLLDKKERGRQSHRIALALREALQKKTDSLGANIKVVEVPPGPPVLSPIVAEVYGNNREARALLAEHITNSFHAIQGVVDIDNTLEEPQRKIKLVVDKEKAALKGIATDDVVQTVRLLLKGGAVSVLHREGEKYALPILLRYPQKSREQIEQILDTKLRSSSGKLIPLKELVNVVNSWEERTIYHKNLRGVDYVVADYVGNEDSPLYGLYKIWNSLKSLQFFSLPVDHFFISQPSLSNRYAMKWDGESQITYETFRDMGIAYGVGVILIYLLVVGQFRSFMLPLIIMAPIPLTLLGIVPGHFIFSAPFTATSMIGAIALAGIIVRNSILLVDFTLKELLAGKELKEALLSAGSTRLRPILLTAAAAMVGAVVILFDPIFQGLAISLLFGVLVSTLLTMVVIPLLLFFWLRSSERLQAVLTSFQPE